MNERAQVGERSDAPRFLERLFDFSAMQFQHTDAPLHVEINQLELVEHLERSIAQAQQASEAAARSAVSSSVSAPTRPSSGIVLGKSDIIELAVQTWRLARRVEGLDAAQFPRERKQFSDSLRRFQKLLETHKVEVTDPVGQVYVDGWVEVEVVSWEPPEPGTTANECRIKQTLAPIVRQGGEILARGQVVAIDITN